MRRITAITFARSDYNSFVPVLRALEKEPDFQTQLIVSDAPTFRLASGTASIR